MTCQAVSPNCLRELNGEQVVHDCSDLSRIFDEPGVVQTCRSDRPEKQITATDTCRAGPPLTRRLMFEH